MVVLALLNLLARRPTASPQTTQYRGDRTRIDRRRRRLEQVVVAVEFAVTCSSCAPRARRARRTLSNLPRSLACRRFPQQQHRHVDLRHFDERIDGSGELDARCEIRYLEPRSLDHSIHRNACTAAAREPDRRASDRRADPFNRGDRSHRIVDVALRSDSACVVTKNRESRGVERRGGFRCSIFLADQYEGQRPAVAAGRPRDRPGDDVPSLETNDTSCWFDGAGARPKWQPARDAITRPYFRAPRNVSAFATVRRLSRLLPCMETIAFYGAGMLGSAMVRAMRRRGIDESLESHLRAGAGAGERRARTHSRMPPRQRAGPSACISAWRRRRRRRGPRGGAGRNRCGHGHHRPFDGSAAARPRTRRAPAGRGTFVYSRPGFYGTANGAGIDGRDAFIRGSSDVRPHLTSACEHVQRPSLSRRTRRCRRRLQANGQRDDSRGNRRHQRYAAHRRGTRIHARASVRTFRVLRSERANQRARPANGGRRLRAGMELDMAQKMRC